MRTVHGRSLGLTPAAVAGDWGVARRVDEETLELNPFADARGWRRMSLESRLAYVACNQAMDVAGLKGADGLGPSTGLVIGSRFGCLSLFEEFHRVLRDEGPRAVSPTVFTTGVLNAPVGHTSLEARIQGPCHTLVGGEAAGIEAVALAWELMQAGVVDRALAVGVEEAPPILTEALRAGSSLVEARGVAEGACALLLELGTPTEGSHLGAVATGRCGRRHDAVQRHAALIRAAAEGRKPIAVYLPGLPGADGDREVAAARMALGTGIEIRRYEWEGYSPGPVSAWIAARASMDDNPGPVIATAAGGRGNTVAIRFDPPSPPA